MWRFGELAAQLGADPETPEVRAARADYEQAKADLAAFVAASPDLSAMFVYAEGEGEVVANPEDWAELAMYLSLGVNLVNPDIPDGTYWEELSAERVDKYPVDVIFQSTRAGLLTPEEMAAHPTYGMLPAVRAGQIGDLNTDVIQSYPGLTAALRSTLGTLQQARDVA